MCFLVNILLLCSLKVLLLVTRSVPARRAFLFFFKYIIHDDGTREVFLYERKQEVETVLYNQSLKSPVFIHLLTNVF